MVNSNLETRTLIDEFRDFEKGWLFDLGHPLLNRIAESFVKAAGRDGGRGGPAGAVVPQWLATLLSSIGAMQAVSREAYFTAVESNGFDSGLPPELSTGPGSGSKKQRRRFPNLRGETNSKSLEALVKSTGKESLQWGLAAGIYSGLTYGLREARGSHDWKNSAVAGALTGMTVALTSDYVTHEQVVQFAITGAAISTAANLLSGIF